MMIAVPNARHIKVNLRLYLSSALFGTNGGLLLDRRIAAFSKIPSHLEFYHASAKQMSHLHKQKQGAALLTLHEATLSLVS